MIVRQLELSEYRNYETLSLPLSPGVNLLFGDNAQGKTNILEAIYECATLGSHRGSKDQEVIRFGSEEAHIRLFMEKQGIESRVDLHLKKFQSKGIAVNGVRIARAADYIGQLHVVFFSPEDLKIIKNSPAERRRFLDLELCQLNRDYLYQLMNYRKVLRQRGELLKRPPKEEEEGLLDVWDEKLSEFGRKIIEYRQKFLEELDEVVGPIHRELSQGREELHLLYDPSVTPERMDEKLFLARDYDRISGSTSVGPHRDEMIFQINGVDGKKYGSQGQQRSAALSLKLAEIELVRRKIEDTPVLLLDDVLSELDTKRQERLVKSLKGVQTVLSCTGLDENVRNFLAADKRFYVKEGSVTEEE